MTLATCQHFFHILPAEGTIHDFTCFLILGHYLVSSKENHALHFQFSLISCILCFLPTKYSDMCQSKFRLVDDQKAFLKFQHQRKFLVFLAKTPKFESILVIYEIFEHFVGVHLSSKFLIQH